MEDNVRNLATVEIYSDRQQWVDLELSVLLFKSNLLGAAHSFWKVTYYQCSLLEVNYSIIS